MNNSLQIFKNEQFGEIRVTEQNGQAMFCLADVCSILELSNSRMVKERLNPKGVSSIDTLTAGGNQKLLYVDESNLYKVIFQSRKPEAEKFTDWVTGEVLPSIRKHGAYMTESTIEQALTSPDFLIQLATKLKEEQTARLEAEKKLSEQKPLVQFAESCIASNDSILVRELAKLASKNGIVIGEKKLYKKLREWGLVLKTKNEPSQYAMEMGLFEVKKGSYMTPYGSETYSTSKVTPKGQIYIIEKLKVN